MWQTLQRLLSTQPRKSEIPSRGSFIDWQLWAGQCYFISPLFTVNVWKIHLVLFLCMHKIWKETKSCLSKKQEHDKNTGMVRPHSHSSNSLCSLCLTEMFANTIEGVSVLPLTSDKPQYCSVIVQHSCLNRVKDSQEIFPSSWIYSYLSQTDFMGNLSTGKTRKVVWVSEGHSGRGKDL